MHPDRTARLAIGALLLAFWPVAALRAAPVAYTNEMEFIRDTEAHGYVWVREGFEDPDAWGTVRSTIPGGTFTAPAITNFGVRFSANTNSSAITTSEGAAESGQWGAYALPHGSYATGVHCDIPGNCGDGLRIACEQPIHGISAWVHGTYGGKLKVILNDDGANPVQFPEVCDPSGEDCSDYGALAVGSKFFGVIDAAGFQQCEIREVEGRAEDQKFIWCDDFCIAFAVPPPPRIRSAAVSGDQAILHLKELAIRAEYTLESAPTLPSPLWEPVARFTAKATETNRTDGFAIDSHHVYLRLRSP